MRAAKNGQINDVESQLTKGASVHEKDYNGKMQVFKPSFFNKKQQQHKYS